jgi:hypothetical protein
MFWVPRSRHVVACALAIGVTAAAAGLYAQSRFDLYLLAVDEKGYAVTDLKASELRFQENDKEGTVVNLERYRWPSKVTVLVDNGTGGASGRGTRMADPENERNCGFDNLVHYRNGLKRFFETLPADVETTLIAMAPNPRYLVRPTSDPVQIQKGVNLLVPDHEFPSRFTDGLTEYAERLDIEFRRLSNEERPPYLPVLVVIGSTAFDGSRIEKDRVLKMLTSLRDYGVATNFIMVSPCSLSGGFNEGITVQIAKEAQRLTGGRYESIAPAATTRLSSLLGEIGESIAVRHLKQVLQYRVTIERPDGAAGPMQNGALALSRTGVRYLMSPNGSFP